MASLIDYAVHLPVLLGIGRGSLLALGPHVEDTAKATEENHVSVSHGGSEADCDVTLAVYPVHVDLKHLLLEIIVDVKVGAALIRFDYLS